MYWIHFSGGLCVQDGFMEINTGNGLKSMEFLLEITTSAVI